MAEHNALGQACRSATIGKRYQVFPPGFDAYRRRWWMSLQQVAECMGVINHIRTGVIYHAHPGDALRQPWAVGAGLAPALPGTNGYDMF